MESGNQTIAHHTTFLHTRPLSKQPFDYNYNIAMYPYDTSTALVHGSAGWLCVVSGSTNTRENFRITCYTYYIILRINTTRIIWPDNTSPPPLHVTGGVEVDDTSQRLARWPTYPSRLRSRLHPPPASSRPSCRPSCPSTRRSLERLKYARYIFYILSGRLSALAPKCPFGWLRFCLLLCANNTCVRASRAAILCIICTILNFELYYIMY